MVTITENDNKNNCFTGKSHTKRHVCAGFVGKSSIIMSSSKNMSYKEWILQLTKEKLWKI